MNRHCPATRSTFPVAAENSVNCQVDPDRRQVRSTGGEDDLGTVRREEGAVAEDAAGLLVHEVRESCSWAKSRISLLDRRSSPGCVGVEQANIDAGEADAIAGTRASVRRPPRRAAGRCPCCRRSSHFPATPRFALTRWRGGRPGFPASCGDGRSAARPARSHGERAIPVRRSLRCIGAASSFRGRGQCHQPRRAATGEAQQDELRPWPRYPDQDSNVRPRRKSVPIARRTGRTCGRQQRRSQRVKCTVRPGREDRREHRASGGGADHGSKLPAVPARWQR